MCKKYCRVFIIITIVLIVVLILWYHDIYYASHDSVKKKDIGRPSSTARGYEVYSISRWYIWSIFQRYNVCSCHDWRVIAAAKVMGLVNQEYHGVVFLEEVTHIC